MVFIGVDPGLDGAMAVIDSFGNATVLPTPTIESTKSNGKKRRDYDVSMMRTNVMANVLTGTVVRCAVELVGAMPGQGVNSMFSMGRGLGVWEGLFGGLGYGFELIRPQIWKKEMLGGVGKDKEASRLRAIQLWPGLDLHRKKDHNAAEALLIAEFLRRKFAH